MEEDFKNSEVKAIVCARYGLKSSQYKALKRYFLGEDYVKRQ